MITDQIDLLKERRELLGEEQPATTNPRRQLIWGTLLASALVGVAGGCWGVVAWLAWLRMEAREKSRIAGSLPTLLTGCQGTVTAESEETEIQRRPRSEPD